jgi:phosphoadenosine phosphosulfate reductase
MGFTQTASKNNNPRIGDSASLPNHPIPSELLPEIEKHGSLAALDKHLESLPAEQRIAWALRTFGENIVLSSSFGAQAAVMLHLVTRQRQNIPVVLVDTGYLFPETYRFIDDLTARLKLNLHIARAEISPAWLEARHGKLWEHGLEGLEKYNTITKVLPMRRALEQLNAHAWLAGLRRSQSSTRQKITVLGLQDGRAKIHPILEWSDKNIHYYLKAHNLPYHPLWHQGYLSIGDWHTSRPVTEEITQEQSRFFGLKRECGLHDNTTHTYEI